MRLGGFSKRYAAVRAERWWCAASRAWARPRCWTTWSSPRRAAAWCVPRVCSRRWNSPSPACTSCWRRCSIVLERLPDPQRDALRLAFGIGRGSPPDRFFVGLAVLGLLSDVAEERPLICVVDDAQWLDRASAQVLAFVARRLQAESVGLVFAAREPSDDLAGLPELVVEGLPENDARALLDSALTGPLDARVRDQIVSETRGNPLALLELPRGLTPAELAGGFGFTAGVPLSRSIEESFRRRLDALPAQTRRLLQLAAADPVGDPVAGVASSRAARDPGCRCDARGRGRPARVRRAGAVPSPAGALGGLPVGVASGATGGRTARWRSSPIRRSIPIAVRGTGPTPRLGPTRTSPRSSSARPAARRAAAAWPRRPRSWSARRR